MSNSNSIQGFVLRENKAQSEAFISEMEVKYLPAIEAVYGVLEELGINPTKELISDAISGNCDSIEAAYRPIIEADKNKFSGPKARLAMETMMKDNIRALQSDVSEWFSGTVGNQYAGGPERQTFQNLATLRDRWGHVPMTDTTLLQFVDIDSQGVPIISEESRAQISRLFMEFATAAQQLIYEAQVKAARALEDLTGALIESGIPFDLELVPHLFIRRFFTVKNTDNEYEITPRLEGALPLY